MTAVTDAMVSAAKQQLPGVWNPARVRKALEAAFALIPEPADPVIPVVASVRVVIDEAAFHRDVAAAVRHLHDGMPHTVDGMIELAALEAELPRPGGLIHPGDIEPLPEWDRCMLGGYSPNGRATFDPINWNPNDALTLVGDGLTRPQVDSAIADMTGSRFTAPDGEGDRTPHGLIADVTSVASFDGPQPTPHYTRSDATAADLAERFGVATSTVRSWVAKRERTGMPAAIDGLFDLDAVVAWHKAWKSGETIEGNNGGG